MRKQTPAGIKAGVLVNVLFSLWPFVVLVGVAGLVGIPRSISSYFPYIIIAFLMYVTFSGIVGAVLGFIFAVGVDRLPLRSIYSKALVLCLCLWALFQWVVSAVGLPMRIIFDLLFFVGFVIESLCFAYLYSKWTKEA